jgi:hypothetical protein
MSLNYDLTKVTNFKKVCHVLNPEIPKDERTESYGFKLNPITEALIWITIGVDIPEITKKNVNEFYWRMRFIQKFKEIKILNGTDKLGRIHTFNPNLKQIKAHIGLKTNASNYTRAQFMQRMKKDLESLMDDILYREKEGKQKRVQQLLSRLQRKGQNQKIEVHNLPPDPGSTIKVLKQISQ